MRTLALIRRTMIGLLGTILGVAVLAVCAQGSEMGIRGHAEGLVIHDAQETLREYTRADANGVLWLDLPGGARYELVTTTDDPAIANPGDGSFHAFQADEVRAALDALSFPLDGIAAHVFILPYPRRSGLESAAAPGLILLSPGVRALSREQQHAELVHELGHVVQYTYMPDSDAEAWDAYRELRGIEDATLFSSTSAHADRPHEIFAEDFRALFGGLLANNSGTIENTLLPHPSAVPGLRAFMEALSKSPGAPRVALGAYPNPTRGAVTFTRLGARASILDVFDAQGRRLASVHPVETSVGIEWRWDGRDLGGQWVQPGVLFARARDPRSRAVRVTLLP